MKKHPIIYFALIIAAFSASISACILRRSVLPSQEIIVTNSSSAQNTQRETTTTEATKSPSKAETSSDQTLAPSTAATDTPSNTDDLQAEAVTKPSEPAKPQSESTSTTAASTPQTTTTQPKPATTVKSQVVRSTLRSTEYPDITVKVNVPVTWIITTTVTTLTTCNSEFTIPGVGSYDLNVGENTIEFTPTQVGDITYSCWMNMLTGTIHVID
jgi:hypothetical protein